MGSVAETASQYDGFGAFANLLACPQSAFFGSGFITGSDEAHLVFQRRIGIHSDDFDTGFYSVFQRRKYGFIIGWCDTEHIHARCDQCFNVFYLFCHITFCIWSDEGQIYSVFFGSCLSACFYQNPVLVGQRFYDKSYFNPICAFAFFC